MEYFITDLADLANVTPDRSLNIGASSKLKMQVGELHGGRGRRGIPKTRPLSVLLSSNPSSIDYNIVLPRASIPNNNDGAMIPKPSYVHAHGTLALSASWFSAPEEAVAA